jgi:hypothetical protein
LQAFFEHVPKIWLFHLCSFLHVKSTEDYSALVPDYQECQIIRQWTEGILLYMHFVSIIFVLQKWNLSSWASWVNDSKVKPQTLTLVL